MIDQMPCPPPLPLLPSADLDHMFHGIGETDWLRLSGCRLFVTGGTGFIGKWLLSALTDADRRLSLGCSIEILTRSPEVFQAAMPHLAGAKGVTLHRGDVRDFAFPSGQFDVVIHGATDVISQQSPRETFSTCVVGTSRALDFARTSGARDFLLTSSGAVYGRHPANMSGVPEDFHGGPDPTLPGSAYGEGKRVSEWLSCVQGAETGLQVRIARLYAQVGPYLPLDKHFAIGNFIGDAMADREILIRGDGTPLRSYLHAADTAIWLWAIMLRGAPCRAWNVGGDEAISIVALAQKIATLLGSTKGIKVLTLADPACLPERYVPDVSRARTELKLPSPIPFDDAILRTAAWLRQHDLLTL